MEQMNQQLNNKKEGGKEKEFRDNVLEDLCEREILPFSPDFKKICGEDILESHFFHPGILTEELHDDVKEMTDLKDQIIHIGDTFNFSLGNGMSFYRLNEFDEKGNLKINKNGKIMKLYYEEDVPLTLRQGLDAEKINNDYEIGQEITRFVPKGFTSYLLIKTGENTFLIQNRSFGNDNAGFPDDLVMYDNPKKIWRRDGYQFSKFPKEAFDDLKKLGTALDWKTIKSDFIVAKNGKEFVKKFGMPIFIGNIMHESSSSMLAEYYSRSET